MVDVMVYYPQIEVVKAYGPPWGHTLVLFLFLVQGTLVAMFGMVTIIQGGAEASTNKYPVGT